MSVIGFGSFLLPRKGTDLQKWAVVACDQYTSSPEYWKKVDGYVGDAPSTLRLICPEAFLAEAPSRLPHIAEASEDYAERVLEPHRGGVLVKRTTASGDRYGLICLLDLEAYSYASGTDAPVRATEGTVLSRIPPRLTVRKASRLDVPHVMCLIDDPAQTVIEPLIGKGEVLYDTDLAFGGGHIEGRAVSDTSAVSAALEKLRAEAERRNKPFVLVGDGNHSLASAKALYEAYRESGDARAKTARYALVELVNLRSPAIVFEPIHRVVFGDPSFADVLAKSCSGEATRTVLVGGEERTFRAPASAVETYRAVQATIDAFGAETDYIHGEGDLRALCQAKNAVGVLMPAVAKDEFFDYIAAHGSLPRKTFSMGEAYEKRYYLECRDLKRPD